MELRTRYNFSVLIYLNVVKQIGRFAITYSLIASKLLGARPSKIYSNVKSVSSRRPLGLSSPSRADNRSYLTDVLRTGYLTPYIHVD